jgi:hypothetical protein
MESNVAEGVKYAQPRSREARQEVASACVVGLKISIPTLIDGMENEADRFYHAWPERLYVLSTEGGVVYQGGQGPYGFDPEDLDRFLHSYLV